MSPARARTRTARSEVKHTNHEATAPPTAWVAGEILRASAFVLVAKPWTRVVKPWEDWWRVKLNSGLPKFVGFFELCIHQYTQISDWLRVLRRQSNVNLYLSSFPEEKVCFHTQICKMYNGKKCIEEAFNWILGISARKAEKFLLKGRTGESR